VTGNEETMEGVATLVINSGPLVSRLSPPFSHV
jgi:hypothetical protein